jgi:hypothetical protein
MKAGAQNSSISLFIMIDWQHYQALWSLDQVDFSVKILA